MGHLHGSDQGIPASPGMDTRPGRFAVFGWSRATLPVALAALAHEANITPRFWNYGDAGTLFVLSNHADIAQNNDGLAIVIGPAFTLEGAPLTARMMLDNGIATPEAIRHDAVRGNAIVICLSLRGPVFSVYQSVVTTSQIFYKHSQELLVCSDAIRYTIALHGRPELNADAIPHHLLFRNVTGSMTYVRDIHKLRPGFRGAFRDGTWLVTQVERLDDLAVGRRLYKGAAQELAEIDAHAASIIGRYARRVREDNQQFHVLLSGGVDSSLLTAWLQTGLAPDDRIASLTYLMDAGSVAGDAEYARHAIDILGTRPDFVRISMEEYPRLLIECIELLAQPIDHEQDPCYLAMAKHLSRLPASCVFSGSSIDTLLGHSHDRRYRQIDRYRAFPAASVIFGALGRVLKPVLPNKAYGMRELSGYLSHIDDPLSVYHPFQTCCMYSPPDAVVAMFGHETLRHAMHTRVAQIDDYLASTLLSERIHGIEFLLDLHDEEANLVQIYRMFGLDFVLPFLDSEFVGLTLSIDARIRYVKDGQYKWLPKQLLRQRVSSDTVDWPKRDGGFPAELFAWMKSGVLRELTADIARPAYMTTTQFQHQLDNPDWLTWNMLTLDLFEKRVLRASRVLAP